jgi:hypothetical protein
MSTPSQHDRIEIWRYIYARSSLVEAREAARLLVAHPEFPDDIKRAIVYQIVIAYARPFTKSQVTDSKRIVPLTSDVVPVEFRPLHGEYLQMRDRTIGHKDAIAFPSELLNKVIVDKDDTGFELHTVSPFAMFDTGLQQTISLCDRLIEHCISKVQDYCRHFVGVGKGTYVLSIEENPAEWLSMMPNKASEPPPPS